MPISLIDEREYRTEMVTRVLPVLAQCQVEGWMEPGEVEGLTAPLMPGKLHYRCYDATRFDGLSVAGAAGGLRGAIVISHGFTEFAMKYAELVWYFLLAGYSVCVLEHRGHGFSVRDIENPEMVWIDDWRRYSADLAKFSSTIGVQYADGEPLLLYSHSMGGGIAAAVMERWPSLFCKAVLSSPMIAPATGVPNWMAKGLCDFMCAIGRGKHAVVGQNGFVEEFDMKLFREVCETRARWYQELRCSDRHYQTTGATYGWVMQALKLSHRILEPGQCERIETPILLFQAERDLWVLNGAQNQFVERVKGGGGNIRMVHVPNSLHEIFSMPNPTIGQYLKRILSFFESPPAAEAD